MKNEEDDCAEDCNESEGSLFDQVVVCPVGDRQDCDYYRPDKDDFCQHPDSGTDEGSCPIDAEEEQSLDPDEDDPGNQDEEDE
jgi:hypothetical protein